jgi:phosphate starvation-inducible PhoH-like protein
LQLSTETSKEIGYQDIILHSDSGAVKAKNASQLRLAQSVQKNDVVFSIGPAGTGKTYLAVAIAVAQLKLQLVRKIVLVRPIVQAGEDLGYLPGDFKMKVNPYLRPLLDALEEFLPRELMKKYLEQEIIEIAPLAYMRGRTLNHAYIILDEAQNTTNAQMKMFLTRLGRSSKAIITGDATQIDLPRNQVSGLLYAERILKGISGIDFVRFSKEDVVRHRLVQDIIQAYDKEKTAKDNEELI